MSSPDAMDWSAGLEHQLMRNMVASVGYQGSHGSNLISAGGNTGNTTYGVDVNIFPGDLIQHPAFNSSGVWTGDGIKPASTPALAPSTMRTTRPTLTTTRSSSR